MYNHRSLANVYNLSAALMSGCRTHTLHYGGGEPMAHTPQQAVVITENCKRFAVTVKIHIPLPSQSSHQGQLWLWLHSLQIIQVPEIKLRTSSCTAELHPWPLLCFLTVWAMSFFEIHLYHSMCSGMCYFHEPEEPSTVWVCVSLLSMSC